MKLQSLNIALASDFDRFWGVIKCKQVTKKVLEKVMLNLSQLHRHLVFNTTLTGFLITPLKIDLIECQNLTDPSGRLLFISL